MKTGIGRRILKLEIGARIIQTEKARRKSEFAEIIERHRGSLRATEGAV
jgi:hypothetical protein